MTTVSDAEDFLARLGSINRGGSASSPRRHKPLFLLVALSRAQHGRPTRMTYQEAAEELTPLLIAYAGTKEGAVYPFWRLRNDQVWEVHGAAGLPTTTQGDVLTSALTDENAGDLPARYADLVQRDPAVAPVGDRYRRRLPPLGRMVARQEAYKLASDLIMYLIVSEYMTDRMRQNLTIEWNKANGLTEDTLGEGETRWHDRSRRVTGLGPGAPHRGLGGELRCRLSRMTAPS
jgi:hypothetical protein